MKKDGKKNGLKSIAEWLFTKTSAKKNGAPVTSSAEKVCANMVTVKEKPTYFDVSFSGKKQFYQKKIVFSQESI